MTDSEMEEDGQQEREAVTAAGSDGQRQYDETDSYTWQRFIDLPGMSPTGSDIIRIRYDRIVTVRHRYHRRKSYTEVWTEGDIEPWVTHLGLATVLGMIDVCHARTVLGIR